MKIGLVCGCFDMFHIGHLNAIKFAKEHCDYLIVGVTNDEYCKKYKNGPIITEKHRMTIISALKYVDEVILVDETILLNRLNFCKEHNVTIVFDGDDWKNSDRFNILKNNGIEVMFYPYTKGISTTEIKNKLKS